MYEHRERSLSFGEIEEFVSLERLEFMEHFGIVELQEEKVSLDERIVTLIQSYLDLDENIEVSIIADKINSLKHRIEIALEFKQKQKTTLLQIKRELKKIDYILLTNLLKLRIHIDRVYKNTEEFALKLKELRYYKEKLDEFSVALEQFESFLSTHKATMHNFYDEDLNTLLQSLSLKKIDLNKTLIPLNQDVIEYINQVSKHNIVVEKIIKLKELKESFELNSTTNFQTQLEQFELFDRTLTIRTILDEEVTQDAQLNTILTKISSKAHLKKQTADTIEFLPQTKRHEYIDIVGLHLEFRSSKHHLLKFLLTHSKLKNMPLNTIAKLYCKMILLYEKSYTITQQPYCYQNKTFKKVYYDSAS